MTTKDLLDDIRKLIETWEDENSPNCLYAEVLISRTADNDTHDLFAWEGEWHHYERKFIDDGPR